MIMWLDRGDCTPWTITIRHARVKVNCKASVNFPEAFTDQLTPTGRFDSFVRFSTHAMPPLANEKKLEVHMVVKLFAILTYLWKRKTMKLTEEKKLEYLLIYNRKQELFEKFHSSPRLETFVFNNRWSKLKSLHGDELESYKVRLESLYCDTDSKVKFENKSTFLNW